METEGIRTKGRTGEGGPGGETILTQFTVRTELEIDRRGTS